jgi:hypothetical protein
MVMIPVFSVQFKGSRLRRSLGGEVPPSTDGQIDENLSHENKEALSRFSIGTPATTRTRLLIAPDLVENSLLEDWYNIC